MEKYFDERDFRTLLSVNNAKCIQLFLFIIIVYEIVIFIYENVHVFKASNYIEITYVEIGVTISALVLFVSMKYAEKKERYIVLEVTSKSLIFLFMIWATLSVFLTQRVMPGVTIFYVAVFYVAIVVRMTPKFSALVYGVTLLMFEIGIQFFQLNPAFVLIQRINSIIVIMIAYITTVIMYRQTKTIYMERMQIVKQNEELQYLADYDPLTDTYNHQKVIHKLRELKLAAKTNKTAFTLALLDINDFRYINDMYGHKKGDKVLKDVAEIIKEHLQEKQYVGRYGGDEFILLLPECDKMKAKVICENITKAIEGLQPFNIPISISLGLCELKEGNYNSIIEVADKNMYKAKIMGKNEVM